MDSLAAGVRNVIARVVTGAIAGVFHPNVMMVLAMAAAVYAAYRTWGVTGGLWAFALIAFLLAMANANQAQ